MSFRVEMTYERTVTFFVDAPSKETVIDFLDANEDWQPGDVPGLIDIVSEEREVDYSVTSAPNVEAMFEIDDELLELVEKP